MVKGRWPGIVSQICVNETGGDVSEVGRVLFGQGQQMCVPIHTHVIARYLAPVYHPRETSIAAANVHHAYAPSTASRQEIKQSQLPGRPRLARLIEWFCNDIVEAAIQRQ
jgi:hypothetical protein